MRNVRGLISAIVLSLTALGADVNAASTGSILNVSIAGERRGVKVQVNQPRKVILPSSGPLAGIVLMQQSADRD